MFVLRLRNTPKSGNTKLLKRNYLRFATFT